MAFTEQDMRAQEDHLAQLEEELSRMVAKQEQALKALGISSEDLKKSSWDSAPAEVKAMTEKAMEEARHAGSARATQSESARPGAVAGHRPGAGRRGIVRL